MGARSSPSSVYWPLPASAGRSGCERGALSGDSTRTWGEPRWARARCGPPGDHCGRHSEAIRSAARRGLRRLTCSRDRSAASVVDRRPKMVGTLRALLARDFTVTLSGHLARLVLRFAASVLVARQLGPGGYGLISLVLATVGITLTIGDLGLRHTAVRALSRDLAVDPDGSARLAASYLCLLVSINVVTTVILAAVAQPLCDYLLGRTDAVQPFRIAMIGMVPGALSGAVATMLQARRQFWRLAATQTGTAISTLLGVVVLFALDGLTVQSVIVLGVLAPLIGATFGVRGIPRAWMAGVGEWPMMRRDWGELLRFSKWLWLSAVC